jgi:hypothetical protein
MALKLKATLDEERCSPGESMPLPHRHRPVCHLKTGYGVLKQVPIVIRVIRVIKIGSKHL